MFNYLLKPLLGLLTVGGLGTGSYFLYKHSISKKGTESQGESNSQSNDVDSSTGQPLDSHSTGGRVPEGTSTVNAQSPGAVDPGISTSGVPAG